MTAALLIHAPTRRWTLPLHGTARGIAIEDATLDALRDRIGGASRIVFEDLLASLADDPLPGAPLRDASLRHALRNLGWRPATGGMQQHLAVTIWEREG